MSCVKRKRLFWLSIKSIFQCACLAPEEGYVSTSLAEISPKPTTYTSKQHRFWWNLPEPLLFTYAKTALLPWYSSSISEFGAKLIELISIYHKSLWKCNLSSYEPHHLKMFRSIFMPCKTDIRSVCTSNQSDLGCLMIGLSVICYWQLKPSSDCMNLRADLDHAIRTLFSCFTSYEDHGKNMNTIFNPITTHTPIRAQSSNFVVCLCCGLMAQ